MKCVICKHNQTSPGFVTVSLTRGTSVIVIKDVPADICENCGEYYLSAEVSRNVHDKAAAAVASGAEVEILKYAA